MFVFIFRLLRGRFFDGWQLSQVRQTRIFGRDVAAIDKFLELLLEDLSKPLSSAEDWRRRTIVNLRVVTYLGDVFDEFGEGSVLLLLDFALLLRQYGRRWTVDNLPRHTRMVLKATGSEMMSK